MTNRKPDPVPPMLIERLPCLFGFHNHIYDGLVGGLDGGKTKVRTKCTVCGDLDYGSELIDYRIVRTKKVGR